MNEKECCGWCNNEFDSDNEGHYDGDAGIGFCQQICEINYANEIGLPENYTTPAN
jgi:hypothetical protein